MKAIRISRYPLVWCQVSSARDDDKPTIVNTIEEAFQQVLLMRLFECSDYPIPFATISEVALQSMLSGYECDEDEILVKGAYINAACEDQTTPARAENASSNKEPLAIRAGDRVRIVGVSGKDDDAGISEGDVVCIDADNDATIKDPDSGDLRIAPMACLAKVSSPIDDNDIGDDGNDQKRPCKKLRRRKQLGCSSPYCRTTSIPRFFRVRDKNYCG